MAFWLLITLILAPLWVAVAAGRGQPLWALLGPLAVIGGYEVLATGATPYRLALISLAPWSGAPGLTVSFDTAIVDFAGWVAPLVLSLVLIYGHVRPVERPVRFYALLALFFSGAELLFLSGSWLTLLLGWELMGLTSYALIAHPSLREAPGRSATHVFLINRIGDIALVVAVAIIYQDTGQLALNATGEGTLVLYGPVVSSCLLLAALTKSAQFPFSRWLIWAMAGPTPVSALLHSATLVSAGAIMLLKAGHLNTEIAFIGMMLCLLTASLGVIRACVARPAKAVLAHSTYSHIGLAMAGILAGFTGSGYLHLTSHALPKAALFLTVGLLGATTLPALGAGKTGLLRWSWPTTIPARREAGRRAALGLLILSLCGAGALAGALTKDSLLVSLIAPTGSWFYLWMIVYTLGTLGYTIRLMLAWVLAPQPEVMSETQGHTVSWLLTWAPVFVAMMASLPWAIYWRALETVPMPFWIQLYPWVVLALVGGLALARPQPLWSGAWGYFLFKWQHLGEGMRRYAAGGIRMINSACSAALGLMLMMERVAQYMALWSSRLVVLMAHGVAALDHVGQFAVSLAGRGVKVTTLTLLGGGASFAPGRAVWLAVALVAITLWGLAYFFL